jgi:hypothetical protein
MDDSDGPDGMRVAVVVLGAFAALVLYLYAFGAL